MGVVVRRYMYIDILIIIITFPYSTCINSFFGSSIPTPFVHLKNVFRSFSLQVYSFIHVKLLQVTTIFHPQTTCASDEG